MNKRHLLYLAGGAALIGGVYYLQQSGKGPFPKSVPGKAKATAPKSVDTVKLGVAIAQYGSKAVSAIDKLFASKAQDKLFAGSDGLTPDYSSTSTDYGTSWGDV